MKKIILTLMLALLPALAALAASHRYESERYFGEKYRSDPTTKVTVITNTGNYFRSIKVEGNPALVAEIKKAVENDRRHADNVTESYSQEKTSIILNLPGGVNMGFTQRKPGDCSLFLQGTPDAFK